jgi:hypothetical protein
MRKIIHSLLTQPANQDATAYSHDRYKYYNFPRFSKKLVTNTEIPPNRKTIEK